MVLRKIINNLDNCKILNKYLAPALFIETNLPAVIIYEPEDPRTIIPSLGINGQRFEEEIDFALTSYIPGKVLFRRKYKYSEGLIIPFRTPRGRLPVFTSINDPFGRYRYYYRVINEEIHIDNYIDDLVKEYKDFINQISNQIYTSIDSLRIYRPISIYPYAFYINYNNEKYLHWLSSREGRMYSLIHDHNYLMERHYNLYNIVDESSNSYCRTGSFIVQSHEKREKKQRNVTKNFESIYGLDYSPRTVEYSDNTIILKYVYALDYNIIVHIVRNQEIHRILRRVNNRSIISKTELRRIRPRRDQFSGVKIFIECERTFTYPVILGYKISETKSLIMKYIKDSMERFIENYILKNIIPEDKNEYMVSSIMNDKLYRILAVNKASYDMLKYYLLQDLIINYALLNECRRPQYLINMALSYNDLFSIDKIVDILSRENAADRIINIINDVNNALLNRDARALLTSLLIIGFKDISCRQFNNVSDTVRERLSRIVGDKFLAESIVDVLVHSFSHHVLNSIIKYSDANSRYLGEIFDLPSREDIIIYETSSGGLGFIESLFDRWSEKQNLLYDMLLRLGECIIGTPEDLVYTSLLIHNDPPTNERNVVKYIEESVRRLDVVILDSEFREAITLLKRLKEEFKNGWRLGRQVAIARYELEKHIKRFAEPRELLVFIITNINRYPILKHFLTQRIAKFIEIRVMYSQLLRRLYGGDNRELAERILSDISSILNGEQTELNDIISGRNRRFSRGERRQLRKIIVDIGRVIDASLMRFYLMSCNNACGFCYINTHGCGKSTAPWIQALTLNRRLLKIFARYILEKNNIIKNNCSSIDKCIGKIELKSGTMYIELP